MCTNRGFLAVLSCAFVAADDETVRQSITFRYNSIKSRLALMQVRIHTSGSPCCCSTYAPAAVTRFECPASELLHTHTSVCSAPYPTPPSCSLGQARLQDINALVKVKNPSLLLQLQRAPPRYPSLGGGTGGNSGRSMPP